MPKGDIKKANLDDGSLVCWVKDYSHVEDPATPEKEKKRIVAALLDCQRAVHISEYDTVPEITGRYGGDESMCCINQAGLYMAIWWSQPHKKGLWYYYAEYNVETGEWEVRERDPLKAEVVLYDEATGKRIPPGREVAVLKVDTTGKEPRVYFEWVPGEPGPDEWLYRFSKRATFSDHAVRSLEEALPKDAHPVTEGALYNEHRPWGNHHVNGLRDALESVKLKKAFERLFRHDTTHSGNWEAIQKDLKWFGTQLYYVFREDVTKDKTFLPHRDDRLHEAHGPAASRMTYHLQEVLHTTSLDLAVGPSGESQTKTAFEWFQDAMVWNETHALDSGSSRLRYMVGQVLGVGSRGQYRYALELDLTAAVAELSMPFGKRAAKLVEKYGKKLPGEVTKRAAKWVEETLEANVGARLLFGTLTVTSEGQAPNWSANYWVMLGITGGGSGGGDVGLKEFKGRGETWTNLKWEPSHFVGALTPLTGQLARDQEGELEENQLILIAEGSNSLEPSIQLLINSDIDTDLSAQAIGIGRGEIVRVEDVDEKPPTPLVPKVFSYTAQYKSRRLFDFRLGSATVREEGRWALRRLAAHELEAFRTGATHVMFDGFADRLGPEGYNDVLSTSRAHNAKVAMDDCLGSSFHARSTVHGDGEQLLKLLNVVYDFPDESPSPEWRRVFVTMHNKATLELVVRDLKGSK